MGYETMTPIQEQSLPFILDGRDLIAQARTGSGKTAAFGLGILHRLNTARWVVQALGICPTRELSEQVAVETRRLARSADNIQVLTLTSGASARTQNNAMAHGNPPDGGPPRHCRDHTDRPTR